MKKIFVALLLIFALAVLSAIQTLTILHTNDHHGRPLAFPCDQEPGGGLPARKALFDQLKKDQSNVLILDAGDINDGFVESVLFNAEPDIKGYNLIGYDAMTIGNHELYKTLGRLETQKKLAKFPFLCANIEYKNRQPLGKPYIIKTMPNGLKVGIIGITTNSTRFSTSQTISSQLNFLDEVETAQKYAKEIRSSVDILIGLVHLGIQDDHNENYGSLKLAKNCQELDFVIDGHSHTYLSEPLWVLQNDGDSVAVVQAACWGAFAGEADLSYENGKVKLQQWKIHSINANQKGQALGQKIEEDSELKTILEVYHIKADSLMGNPVGLLDKNYEIIDVRKTQTDIGGLIADAMLWYGKKLKTDFAITNGGGIRNAFKKGAVTKRDIYNTMPFDNSVDFVELTGKQILEIFSFNAANKIGTGGFLQFSTNVIIKYQEDGKSIKEIRINNKKLNSDKIYKIATNSYLADGGDGYFHFKQSQRVMHTQILQRDLFEMYLREKGNK